MSEFIVCPKCKRRSYHKMDISCEYCPSCGYHDSPVDAPLGVPGVSAKWRQPTPTMQLRAEWASMQGHFENWREKIISDADFEESLDRHIASIKEIHDHVEKTGRADAW